MTTEEVGVIDGPEVEDLADIATAFPVVHKRLDFARLNVAELLSLGDIADMAKELGTDPDRLASVLQRDPSRMGLEVTVVLAWIIGRKRDPLLELEEVRRFWQVEVVGVGTTKPDPTLATRIRRSSGRPGSSRTHV